MAICGMSAAATWASKGRQACQPQALVPNKVCALGRQQGERAAAGMARKGRLARGWRAWRRFVRLVREARATLYCQRRIIRGHATHSASCKGMGETARHSCKTPGTPS